MTRRFAFASLLAVLLLAVGCDPSPLTLTVRVQSGLRAGHEARHVEVRLYDGSVPCRGGGTVRAQRERALEPGDQVALAAGQLTVAELGGLAAGTYTVRALVRRPAADSHAAADAGEVILSRCTVVSISASRVLRVPLTVDCLDVECPAPMGSPSFTECLHGRCVDPRCVPDDPSTHELCCDRALLGSACDDAPTLCGVPADCRAAGCTDALRCEDGVCIEPEEDRCPAGSYCARSLGECLAEMPLPGLEDAGPPDAGEIDGGGLEVPDAHVVPDAYVVPDAWSRTDASLFVPPALSVISTFVGTADVSGVAARGTGVVLTGHSDGSFTLFGSSVSGGSAIGFHHGTDVSSGGFFELSPSIRLEDGPGVAIIDGATVITGGAFGTVSPAVCGRVSTDGRDGYVFVLASGGCRFLRATAAAGSETLGVPVGWRDAMGAWQALVPVRADGGAFGATFPSGAVASIPVGAGSTGMPSRMWTLPFQPRALAVVGDDLVVVGDNGNVIDLDLRLPVTAPPRWSAVWEHPEALWTTLLGVAADASGVYAVASVTSRGTGSLPGGDDAWIIAAGRDGVRLWDLVIGGLDDDHARVVASHASRLYVGGMVTGPTIAGLRSGSGAGPDALLLELAADTGVITGVQRVPDGSTVGVTVGATGTVTFATEHTLNVVR